MKKGTSAGCRTTSSACGVGLEQQCQRRGAVLDVGRGGEERGDVAVVGLVQAGLGALQHRVEAVAQGDVEPGGRARELEEPGQPLGVRHGVDVAEVRLGRAVQRLDDLVAPGLDGLGVAGDLVEQATGLGRGVVDLVDVGAELAAAGRHAADGGAGADPVGRAGGVDEQLLDLGRGGRLERRHRRGGDEDAVDAASPGSRGGAPRCRRCRRTRPRACRCRRRRRRRCCRASAGRRRSSSRSSSRSSQEWWPPALPPSIWTISGSGATASAMATTWRICLTVPGLNTTCSMPTSRSSSTSATASSRSGMPAVTTTESTAEPAARACCTRRWPPRCSFHRYGSRNSELKA